VSVVETARRPVRGGPAVPGSGTRVWRWVVGAAVAVAACWAVTLAADAVRQDWVLPVLVLLGTAALLRSGRTLLDRLVLAFALLVGPVCVAGVGLSAVRWGMEPVPVGGGALSALVVVAAVLRRRPALPRRVIWTDGAVLGTGLAAAAVIWYPFVGKDFAGRLGLSMWGEDYARHFSLFDAIRLVGGYVDQHQAQAAPHVRSGMTAYPAGSHFLDALLDNFVRSSTAAGGTARAYDHYLLFSLGWYALLAAALVWALRWAWGVRLRGLPAVAAGAVVAAVAIGGYPAALWMNGFAAEVAGLALFALLVPLLIRPPRRREYVLLVCSLVVAVSFVYTLLLPVAALGAVCSAVVYRRRLRRVRVLLAVAVPVGVVAALYWPAWEVRFGFGATDLVTGGAVKHVDRGLVLALALVGLAGAWARGGRRLPVHRMVGALLLVALGCALAVAGYQYARAGFTSYYFTKALHPLLVTGLVALGGPALLLRRPGPATATTRREVALGAAVVAAALFAVGLPLPRSWLSDADWGRQWMLVTGQTQAPLITEIARRYPADDGMLTLKVGSGHYDNYLLSLYLSVLRRDDGTSGQWVNQLMPSHNTRLDSGSGGGEAAGLEWLAGASPHPVRYVCTLPSLTATLQAYAADHPELRMEVIPASAFS
jgi:hypothetical protein